MVLIDTSIWIDHFRKTNHSLLQLLDEGGILLHPFVIGEMSLGNLKHRDEVLGLLKKLPQVELLSDEEVLIFVEKHKLFGKGIGWIDAHLLASAYLSQIPILTHDKNLNLIAKILNLFY